MITVEAVKQLDLEDIAQILELFKKIPGRTCSAAAFLDYMSDSWNDIQLVIGRDDDKIKGFTIAAKPSLLEPKIGWLPFSSFLPSFAKKFTKQAFKIAEQWLIEQGADTVRFTSVRKPVALKRTYGVTPSKEVLYEKQLTV